MAGGRLASQQLSQRSSPEMALLLKRQTSQVKMLTKGRDFRECKSTSLSLLAIKTNDDNAVLYNRHLKSTRGIYLH